VNNFDLWNAEKKHINHFEKPRFCKEREIWWCSFGINIGHEENGKGKNFRRPVLVLKKFSTRTALVVPLTKSSTHHKFKIKLSRIGNFDSWCIISQLRVIDTRRFTVKITEIEKSEWSKIKKIVRKNI
jgi:mRNA-degrading endonuclease toxin of MazEF toxin-antitoxin module